MVLFTTDNQPTCRYMYVCIIHCHIYFIGVTTNCQINRSFIKSFDQLFSVFYMMGVSCKVKAAMSANQKRDVHALIDGDVMRCFFNGLHFGYISIISAVCGANITRWVIRCNFVIGFTSRMHH